MSTLAIPSALGHMVPATHTAAADDPFYKGKTIALIIGSNASGGYDGYGRLLARHMGKYIPGNPDFVVQNMPGANGVRAASHVYSVAAQDGTGDGHFRPGDVPAAGAGRARPQGRRGEVQLDRTAGQQQRRAVLLAHRQGAEDRGRVHARTDRRRLRRRLAAELGGAQRARRHEIPDGHRLRRARPPPRSP